MNIARHLVLNASAPYRAAGRYAYYFARNKLARDPVFAAISSRELLVGRGQILDLGCGQGLLAAWLLATGSRARVRGIELVARYTERARAALGNAAEFVTGDLRRTDFGAVDGIVILDVLHYIDYPEQRRILVRVRQALLGGGILLLRVGDAGSGMGFKLGMWVDQMMSLLCGHGLPQLHCRSASQWRELLHDSGFDCESVPMSAGTPFSNVLLIARPR